MLVVAFWVGVRTEAPNKLFAKEAGLFIFLQMKTEYFV